MNLQSIFRQKIGAGFIFSYTLFLICMGLDFYMTTVGSGGNYNYEGNIIGRLWWQIAGSLRFIEIPAWAAIVFATGFLIHYKSKFFALVWFNFLAFNHLIGFLTWLPQVDLNLLYSLIKEDWLRSYAISAISIPAALVLAFLQTKIKLR